MGKGFGGSKFNHMRLTQIAYQLIVLKPFTNTAKWLQHVQRMDTNSTPKQALQYRPKGRRNIGRPRKRCRDQLLLEFQGTGNTLTFMYMMMMMMIEIQRITEFNLEFNSV
jgi:hypothetical protein